MFTLPHHVEFLSDDWLAEASRFLERETRVRKARLGGRRLSISERFADAPPHLKMPGDVAGWSMRYDGERAEVSRDFDASADVVVEGDYQAALMSAQFVGVLAPGGAAEMRREREHLFGKDAVRVKGALADEQAGQLLGALHDHMARRTVENPDLAHRAARLGLSGKIREMEEQGYTVIERAISPTFADEARAAILREIRLLSAPSMMWSLYHGREFERLAVNPMLMTLIDASLGRGAVIASLASTIRGPGKGEIGLHTDYIHVPEPYPEFALTGVGVWSFENWTASAGPTWLVPGSHRMRRGPKPGEGRNGGVPIEMPKGSVVFFTHGVWHWQGDRSDPGERVALHAHFNRGILRSLEPKRIDPQLLHRNPPRLGEMLGEDDMFDKMSAEGRDYLRGRYMGELLTFNQERKQAILEGAF
jgi:ectoine hydroxylase-related dioxygenase (phytanoyl-CoA dioxygenase family)